MPTKKPAKAAAKPAAKAAKKAAPAPAAKKATPAKPVARPVAAKAKAASKPAPKAPPVKAAAKPVKAEPVKAAKPAPKAAAPKPAPAPKAAAKPAPAPKPVKAARPAPAPKPEPAQKPAKAAKPVKPPKLAPVEAAFAKPKPAKPLAVAAGRAQPINSANGASAPARPLPPPKTLAAPKPVAAEPEVAGDLQIVPAFKGKTNGAKGMVLVGAIAGAYGVKGEVRIRAFTEKKDGVIAYGPLHGEDGKVLLKPKNWRELKDGVAVVAPEVKNKEQADGMRGQRLYVPRANLPATAEDEFYIVDLLGCRAEALDGKVLGEIVAVWNFGAGDIIEYRPPNGGPNVRITFTRDSAPLVDLAGKRVVLDPPAPEPEPVGK